VRPRAARAGRTSRGRATFFQRIGRFAVARRWVIVAFWLLATVGAVTLLPSLGGVIKNDTTAFLPASAPSVAAARLAAPFLLGSQQSGTLVALRGGAPLTSADQAAFGRIEASARRAPWVSSVRDAAVSTDGMARTAILQFSNATAGGGHPGAAAVGAVRSLSQRLAPRGLDVYLTGPLPELVDQQAVADHTANHVQLVSAVFILLVLVLAFRSLLAPIVTLAPAGLALALAGPLIAESTHVGVQVSSLMQLLLTALVLGAGTDYGLFLIFRYRENLRAGLEPTEAIVAAVDRVGEAITFSAATVIAALLSLLLASFGLYRGVGPGLALGIAIVLAVELTLFPALLAIFGRAVFWPSVVRHGPARPGRWGAVAARVSGRPIIALVASTLGLSLLALTLLAYAPSGFNPGGFIAGSNSGIGENVLVDHFGASALNDTDIVFRLPRAVWGDPSLIDAVSDRLGASGAFSSVTDALSASGLPMPPRAFSYAYGHLGPPGALPAVPPPGTRIDRFFYDAYRGTAGFITGDGRTILYRVSLRAGSPGSTAALQAIPGVRATVTAVARQIGAVDAGVAGQAAGAADVSSVSGKDIVKIAPVVLVVLALLLALVLRSLIAPLYLVASVALSYLASLGLTVLIFVIIGNQLGINFTLPFFMFVFIMALGEDYNILVMTRIREENEHMALRPSVARAIGSTGTTVTSAGLVLAGTFGVLAAATSGQVRQIGTGLALGILLDTFVVRTLLVPATVVLVGRWNWWPSRRFYEPEPSGPTALPASHSQSSAER